MSELSSLCEKVGIHAEVKYGAPANPEFSESNPWTVTLRYGKRRLTTPFYTGYAISREPTAADVLLCIVSDATRVEDASDFQEWARDLGYRGDLRRAEKIWKACIRLVPKLRRFLGDQFDAFANAQH